jgi:hypothetical protein
MQMLRLIPCALAALFASARPCARRRPRAAARAGRRLARQPARPRRFRECRQRQPEGAGARTIYRPGELLEAAPGLIASQHSGEGKANQFYLRGFNLDHGTDLATWVDDMPVNQRSHAHGQGWTDLNFLIPELVGAPRLPQGAVLGARRRLRLGRQRRRHLCQPPGAKTWAASRGGQNGLARACWPASPELYGGTLHLCAGNDAQRWPVDRGPTTTAS